MALHMVDDPNDGNEDYADNSGGNSGFPGGNIGGGGGLGGLLSFLPLILSFIGRNRGGGNNSGGNNKKGCGCGTLILLAIIGFAIYYFGFSGGCNSLQSNTTTAADQFSPTGYDFNPNETKKAQVYESLEADDSKNPLPEAVSLLQYAPDRRNQGEQGSCVAWSSAYAAQTILQAAATHQNPNQIAYSPSFLYNNIALDNCQGSYIQRAMEFMSRKGSVPLSVFPYDERSCSNDGNSSIYNLASQNKIYGFTRLTNTDEVSGINIRAIKEHLAKDAPVVIGMLVGGSFMQDMMGQKVWHPNRKDANMMGFGGHAMCIIGYDDRVEGGAFQIMNSWGPEWGQNGIGYVCYRDFEYFAREAYGLEPFPQSAEVKNLPFEASVGLVANSDKKNVYLQKVYQNTFQTSKPLPKGSTFKISVRNKVPCYIYIFTPDVAGNSIVLFPYKPIHSAYCGITGYRLFPKAESIQVDSIGNRDVMAVVVSKQQLDYNNINNAINSASGQTYEAKVNSVFANKTSSSITYNEKTGEGINFSTPVTNNNIVLTMVQIDKQ